MWLAASMLGPLLAVTGEEFGHTTLHGNWCYTLHWDWWGLIWELWYSPELVHAMFFKTYHDCPWKQRSGSKGIGNKYTGSQCMCPLQLSVYRSAGLFQLSSGTHQNLSSNSISENRRFKVKIWRAEQYKSRLFGLLPSSYLYLSGSFAHACIHVLFLQLHS